MIKAQLQLYHKYKAMANNFLGKVTGFGQLYRNRTLCVLVTNRFVQYTGLISWKSSFLYSGMALLA